MASEEGRPVPGAAVVCLNRDRVLLAQRGREPNRGRWSFPGGKVEPGETGRAAAAREALEETGIRCRVLDVVDVYDAIFPPYHFLVADYLAVPEDRDAVPVPGEDCLDARWVPFTEVEAYNITPEMHRVLDRARWLRRSGGEAPPCLGIEQGLPELATCVRTHEELRAFVRGLYMVTDDTLSPEHDHVLLGRMALHGGARIVQLRDKRRDAGELLPMARHMAGQCRVFNALFIVNDRVDLAVAADAHGVHLGQTDLPIPEARKLLGPERLIGISVENEEQVRRAEAEGADYLGVGAIYGSRTKLDAGEAVGPEQIRRFRAISRLPIVAIGGITLERVPEVIAAGADSVAVVGAVASAPDPVEAAESLTAAIERALRERAG